MLFGIPVASLTPSVLLGIFVLFMFLGILVPWRTLKKETEEKEKWHKAYETEREARTRSDAQTTQLLELAKTTNTIVVTAFGANKPYRESGGEADVVSAPKTR